MDRHRVAIIIPAFNESSTIRTIVKNAKRYGSVIVIDDNSKDDTGIKAQKAGAIVIKNQKNNQYDKSLHIGLSKAIKMNFKFAISIDGDGQHDVNDIKKILKLLFSGKDLVIGIRPKIIRFSEKITQKITKMKWGLKDPYCGLKGYRISYLKRYKELNTYDSVGTQLTFRMISDGAKFSQTQINIFSRKDESRFGSSVISNLKILRATFFGLLLHGLKVGKINEG